MSWKLDPKIADILMKAENLSPIDREEAIALIRLPLHSRETCALMETADRMSRERFRGKGENHFHIGINAGPCPLNCRFCSLAREAGIFRESIDFSDEQIVAWARDAEAHAADALNIMTTGTFPFQRLLDLGRLLKKEVAVPIVANTRDVNHREAEALMDAGFVGAYHAVRLGEGRDTPLDPRKRIETIKVFQDVGLKWMNCVEPVGPEHAPEEIAGLMLLAREYKAVYSGVMRRVNFPGSPMSQYGMITELEMARLVAVSRLVMGDIPAAHCTHEPHTLSLIAGANLFFPEVGASPRDCAADTGKGRAGQHEIHECRRFHRETGWDPDKPSNCF